MKNQKGFSLVQVLVAVGIASIGMLAMTTMSTNSMKANKSVEVSAQITDLVSLMRIQLGSADVCKLRLLPYLSSTQITTSSLATTSLTASRVDSPNGSILFEAGKPVATSPNLTVESITIDKFQDLSPSAFPGTAYMAEVTLKINKASGVAIGAQSVVRALPVFFKTTLSGGIATINSCSISSSSLNNSDMYTINSTVCTALAGTFDGTECLNAKNVQVRPTTLDSSTFSAAAVSDIKNLTCTSVGGTFDGTNCNNAKNVEIRPTSLDSSAFSAEAVRDIKALVCTSVGGTFDGTNCKNIKNIDATLVATNTNTNSSAPSSCAAAGVTIPASQCFPSNYAHHANFLGVSCDTYYNSIPPGKSAAFNVSQPGLVGESRQVSLSPPISGFSSTTATAVCGADGNWTLNTCRCTP